MRPGGIARRGEEGKMIDAKQREAVRQAAGILVNSISWEGSRKGGRYWEDVYDELMRISESGEP